MLDCGGPRGSNKVLVEVFNATLTFVDVLLGSLRAGPVAGVLDFADSCAPLGGLGGSATLHAVFRVPAWVDIDQAETMTQIFNSACIVDKLSRVGLVWPVCLTLWHHRTAVFGTKKLKVASG